jgi:ABC-2 type transport system ATP-binding protein
VAGTPGQPSSPSNNDPYDYDGDAMTHSTARLRDLVVSYGRHHALDGVDLDLHSGVTGLLGPNGAGKTTLLRLLATVDAPDGGTLEVLGHRVNSATDRTLVRRQLGYLPQEPGFHRNFTVFAFIDYVAILKEHVDRRARHGEVRRVIQQVGLEDRAQTKIRKLSGGMRRRVALAQALLGDPQLLILDEPTVGLDPELRFWFRDLVSQLGEDRTVLLSTHQTEDVSAVCQRVVVLDQGRIRFDGTPAELAAVADGHTWMATERHPDPQVAWRTADGSYRHLGTPPAGAHPTAATIEDGYLLLVGEQAQSEVAA